MRRHETPGKGPTPRTFPHWLWATARPRWDLDAVSDPGVRFTYGELMERTHRAALQLLAAGLERGRPVCFALGPSADYCAWILGALLAGGVAAPVNTRLAAGEVAAYVERLRPALVVADPGHGHLFAQTSTAERANVASLAVAPDGADLSTPPPDVRRTVEELLDELRIDDPAIIFPTGEQPGCRRVHTPITRGCCCGRGTSPKAVAGTSTRSSCTSPPSSTSR